MGGHHVHRGYLFISIKDKISVSVPMAERKSNALADIDGTTVAVPK
jgi:hypothetical protein